MWAKSRKVLRVRGKRGMQMCCTLRWEEHNQYQPLSLHRNRQRQPATDKLPISHTPLSKSNVRARSRVETRARRWRRGSRRREFVRSWKALPSTPCECLSRWARRTAERKGVGRTRITTKEGNKPQKQKTNNNNNNKAFALFLWSTSRLTLITIPLHSRNSVSKQVCSLVPSPAPPPFSSSIYRR